MLSIPATQKSLRRKMVRKQIYLLPQQGTQLKELARKQQTTEAELIRQAVETLLNQPPVIKSKALPPHEGAWQVIMTYIEQREQQPTLDIPYQWSRADGYDDERAARAWNSPVT